MRRNSLLYAAVFLSLVAGTVHLVLVPEHWDEWWGYGVFFAVAAGSQFVFAAVFLRSPTPSWLAAGIAGNLAIIGLYLVTRTFGIPYGPATGEVEEVIPLDVVSKAAEGLLVAVLVVLRLSKPTSTLMSSRAVLPSPREDG